MDPMAILALATAVFLATHYVSSTPLRAGLVRMLGENGYLELSGWIAAASVRLRRLSAIAGRLARLQWPLFREPTPP